MNAIPPTTKRLIILVALTTVLSLVFGVQYYLKGPIHLTVVNEIRDLAIDANGSLAAAGTQDGTIRLWEIPSGQDRITANWPSLQLTGHTGPVVRLFFDQRGTKLVSASRDGTVRVWDVASGQAALVIEVPGKSPLNDASMVAGGSTMATVGDDGMVYILDLVTGDVKLSIGPTPGVKRAVALSSDGALVAAGVGKFIRIWDAHTGDPVQTLEGNWEDAEKQEDWLGHKGVVTTLAFSPTGDMLTSGSTDKKLIFWEMDSGEAKWTGDGHFAAITKLVYDTAGTTVISGSADNKAKTWRATGGKVTGTFVGHLSTVNGVVFGPGPQSVLTGGNDGTLRLWDTVNTTDLHVEWTVRGLQPEWGKLFGVWMLVSGLIGLLCVWGLWRIRGWGHLLTLGLYVIGPIVVLGLPLLETLSYPFSLTTRLQIAWPLLALAVWYAVLAVGLMRESVVTCYAAPRTAPLAEQLMATIRGRQLRAGLFIGAVWVGLLVLLYSVLRQFNLDVAFMGHFLSFIMAGSGYTVLVSAASITLAVILALLGALGRLSNNAITNGISGFYISLIRGTPLLVQIYIWYLGLPRLNIVLDPIPAGILALGVNYGAYMTETFRAGIQAIGKGQHEAAQALGMSRPQTLRRIVLPQAFRIVIPPIGNDFIAMMKDSSLVSIMTVQELTWRANKLGRQYFRGMETFVIAAAFYWVLTVVFQFLQGKLETYMARGERK